ncbi:major facilitator superfamily domain-containing protein [Pseudomassariella vexata]|uniref:Major facilitator superfamily domain-containing protein n=1 Tax=Pseudomassariella vexata TaxID=1141098 RepID=A0A1Y2DP49_9PEZI|nr:major facilitator superfamily domain-containing protein [Pseudomassariella vexata]ORY60977.1 major facilitator superfamily domain-containing protein [Pseudomassariella vexata]
MSYGSLPFWQNFCNGYNRRQEPSLQKDYVYFTLLHGHALGPSVAKPYLEPEPTEWRGPHPDNLEFRQPSRRLICERYRSRRGTLQSPLAPLLSSSAPTSMLMKTGSWARGATRIYDERSSLLDSSERLHVVTEPVSEPSPIMATPELGPQPSTPAPAPEIHQSINDAMARRIVRKIDWRIIPLLFTTYLFNFMDKTILSSAAVFGLKNDNHLVGQQYSWVSSVFYFGYFFWTYPTTLLIARVPVGKYIAINTFFWGAVVALTAACSSYGGLITVRFLLGVAEATITPALMFITSTWYTRDEVPVRTGIWFAGNSIGGIVSSLLAYGLGHIAETDKVGPWRAMFILLGGATFIWGFVIFFLLPDSISKAKFLTPEERQWAGDRVVIAGTGSTDKTVWKWDQMLECLSDPKTWLIWSITILCQIPNGGTQNFANLVIVSFGFTSLQSTLINIPYSLITAGFIFGTGWLAGRFRSLNCILAACIVIPPVVGSALIGKRGSIPHGASLFGYFCLSTGPAALPLILSLVQTNFRGVTKKMTMTAMVFIAYCAGNIAGPQLFKASEAPLYGTAFQAIMICYALVICLALVLRFYLQFMNTRRVKEEGVDGSAGTSGAVGGGKVLDITDGRPVMEVVNEVQLRPEDYEDVTDWKTFGFRYRL